MEQSLIEYEAQLKTTADYLLTLEKEYNFTVVWKSIAGGHTIHRNFEDFDGDGPNHIHQDRSLRMKGEENTICNDHSAIDLPNFLNRTMGFQHSDFYYMDKVAKRVMKNYSIPFLDISPIYLRPEAHNNIDGTKDCLHFCMPGPLILYSWGLSKLFFGGLS